MEEGKVASFLLATSAVAKLHCSPMKKKMLLEVGNLHLLPGTFFADLIF